MGVYDYIVCNRIMPDGMDGSTREFQTKDTPQQYLMTYTITDAGRLVCDRTHFEETPQAERPYPKAKRGTMEALRGVVRTVVDEKDVDQNFHGYINFYDAKWSNEEQRDLDWYEYTAKFTDGDLVEIVAHEGNGPRGALVIGRD